MRLVNNLGSYAIMKVQSSQPSQLRETELHPLKRKILPRDHFLEGTPGVGRPERLLPVGGLENPNRLS